MTDTSLGVLIHAVQYNCNISDACHGTDFSLCIYLMKMREYYRWEKRLPLDAALERGLVGDWLQAREALWEKLESWRWNRPDNALGRAFACYDFENALDASLDAMTDREIDIVLFLYRQPDPHAQGSVPGIGEGL